MATGNRLLIVVLAIVILCGVTAGFVLDWSGKGGEAAFTALATTALGILCPSPLRQVRGSDGPEEGGGSDSHNG
ncbi:MAG TPA: hypothetical protein VKT77_21395 [Chthonomonadaceae bacterium]|nr:hypothetical protein [Chthonomonadaceae bacterium]